MIGVPALLAVHISDGILVPEAAYAGIFAAFGLLVITSRRLSDDEISRLGLFTAAVFVASQIHVPAGGGVSMHLLFNSIAGIVLGRRVVIAIGVAVFLQYLLFFHGGLTTWGINTLNMSLPAVFAGWVFHRCYRRWPSRVFTFGMAIGLFTSTLTILLCGLVVYFFGINSEWVVGGMVATQWPVIVLEGFITASLLQYLAAVKPEWLTTPAA